MQSQNGVTARTFWAWWWPSITAWLPEKFQRKLNPTQNEHILRWTVATVESTTENLDRDANAVLLLPRILALVRSLQLPGATIARLRDVVQFEIERQTPFPPDQVYFDVIPERPFQRGQSTLFVRLVVVPKGTLDAAVQTTAAYTKRLVAVDVESADGTPLGVNLLPVPQRYRPSGRWHRWNLALALVCTIAIFGLLMGLLHARQRGVAQLEQQATVLLRQAGNVERREMALMQARRLATDQSKAHAPTTLDLLSQLSVVLPLDSYFLQVELNDGVVTARGETTDLSAVLRALGNSTLWKTPELTGSRALPDGKKQEFSLRLHLRDRTDTRTP